MAVLKGVFTFINLGSNRNYEEVAISHLVSLMADVSGRGGHGNGQVGDGIASSRVVIVARGAMGTVTKDGRQNISVFANVSLINDKKSLNLIDAMW